jgi:flagellar motor switch protein FliM
MEVKIGGRTKFLARPGIVGVKKGVQITGIVEEFSDELLRELKKGGEEE